MPNITNYLNTKTLKLMMHTFSSAMRGDLRIVDALGACVDTGEVLPIVPGTLEAHINIEHRTIGTLRMAPPEHLTPQATMAFLKLLAAMLSSMCHRQQSLRNRIDDLTTLYRLTTEFTGHSDLQTVLDTVCSTVVALLKVRSSTIRLLNDDGTEMSIKSANNIDDANLITKPIPLADSPLDEEALRTQTILYVPDLETDSRVLFPEGARAEGLVSALVAPLIYKGDPIGVLRVYSDKPQPFDKFDQAVVLAIATQAAAAIASARLNEQALQAATMKRQLRLAAEVQRRMFPRENPTVPGMDIAALYDPCFELGGDFYDFIALPDENLGIALGDVVGKGIRASLVTASVRSGLRAHTAHVYDIAEICSHLNTTLYVDTVLGDFATLFYGVLDASTHRLTYVSAGHPPAILFRNGVADALQAGPGALGIDPDWTWSTKVQDLLPGDVLFVFSDGLPEAVSYNDEAFGMERLVQAVQGAIDNDMDADGICHHVQWTLRTFTGFHVRNDDLTMIAVKVL